MIIPKDESEYTDKEMIKNLEVAADDLEQQLSEANAKIKELENSRDRWQKAAENLCKEKYKQKETIERLCNALLEAADVLSNTYPTMDDAIEKYRALVAEIKK